ncbi:gustatory receptor 5a for trehalose-like [Leguminivora glycinivorella]|uniref:gustatory receptor 5a for trehalose-like n=1 Tax=Leguminivora glycinivorella TaxID=1035111 RepID=UPI0020101203|nr:gustatory receptor 5a for trehalose-like [Leguminivora glycinivorella]
MTKTNKLTKLFIVSETKLNNDMVEVLRHHNLKLQPEIFMTPLLTSDYNGFQATFQEAMKVTIIIGQFFGLNPVIGVSEINTTKLKFQIKSCRFIYSLLSIIGQCTVVSFSFLKLFTDSNPNLSANSALVFSLTNCITTILFLRVATRWPRLCQLISKTEVADPSIDRKLIKKCRVSCFLVLTMALLEHVLSDLSSIAGIIDCQKGRNVYEAFVIGSTPWVFQFTGYSPFIAMFTQIISIQFTFNWNFSDLFVICISFYLTSRLEQVNRRIESVFGKHVPSSFWRTLREDYSRITGLVRRVDDVIGSIIFISFANNLFFICVQLLHTLAEGIRRNPSCRLEEPDERPFHGYEQTVYFVYSFGFLITRSLAVSLIASGVHTASREPAHTLYFVPSTAYSVEVQRFLDQIHGDTIALSGLNFFNVKRGLVLTIAGTIVTYELVLMQFTGVSPTSSPSTITIPIFINSSYSKV